MARQDKDLVRIVNIIILTAAPEEIILFGSRARRRNGKGSDYDIFILVKNSRNPREIEKKLYVEFAKQGIAVPVDIIVDTQKHFSKYKTNQFLIYHNVAKYGKKLYERKTAASQMA